MKTSFVYFVHCPGRNGGSIKIGVARDLKKRLSALQIGNPRRLELLAIVEGGREVDRQYHRAFCRSHIHGEWFKATPDLMEHIEFLIAESEAA